MFIRIATLEDTERVAHLNHELDLIHASYHPLYKLKENAFELSLPYLKEKIERSVLGDGLVLVAQEDGIVGFLTCTVTDITAPQWENSKVGHIILAYVIPACRHRGIASALVKEAFKWLKERKVEYVDLDVAVENREAIAAWASMGFKLHRHNMIYEL